MVFFVFFLYAQLYRTDLNATLGERFGVPGGPLSYFVLEQGFLRVFRAAEEYNPNIFQNIGESPPVLSTVTITDLPA